MDVSGPRLHLDHAGLTARRATLAARLEDLVDERLRVAEDVDSLLRGWRGVAADELRAHWHDWRGGADGVLAALGASLEALDLARADLGGADVRSSAGSTRLAGRLG